jgi:hypothetical protein
VWVVVVVVVVVVELLEEMWVVHKMMAVVAVGPKAEM